MSDYDLKNIPVLDDVIEEDASDETEVDNEELAEEGQIEEENSIDLFSDESADSDNVDPVDAEPELTDENIDEQDSGDQNSGDEEPYYPDIAQTSIQIAYQEIYDKSINLLKDDGTDESDTNDHIDEHLAEAAQISIDPIELEEIVGSTVKQLLPDLEQQLRFLIQRALEDRLPAEIIKSIDAEPDIDTDIDTGIDNT